MLHEDKRDILFELIAQQRVGNRPDRIEHDADAFLAQHFAKLRARGFLPLGFADFFTRDAILRILEEFARQRCGKSLALVRFSAVFLPGMRANASDCQD